jgi:hypothetical protein
MDQAVYLVLKYILLIAATAQTLDINVVYEMFGRTNSQVLADNAAKCGFHTKNDLHVCSNRAISGA